jgi:hypothetical protein
VADMTKTLNDKEVVDFKLSPFGRHTFYGVDIKP